jgi:gamma-glutamyltranspeptidase/glutathione hydrolase
VPVTLKLAKAGSHTIGAVVSDATPTEFELANNDARQTQTVWMYTADGAASSQHSLATAAGIAMLKAGGNAIDAAAAMQWVLNVTQPHLNGIGGGATMLVHLASGGDFAVDARETAPAATTPTTYVGAPAGLATSGAAVGVPGTLAGVDLMLKRWGTRPLAETLQPAIRLARDGFPAGIALARACGQNLTRRAGLSAICRGSDGTAIKPGDLVVEADLAKAFELIAAQGPSALYTGEIARATVAAVGTFAPAGRMTLADLADYAVDVRAPIKTQYHGVQVVSVPPSSAGGLVLLQALGLVQRFPIGDRAAGWGFGDVNSANVMIEAIRLALADRAMWMGDDRFFPVPKEGLVAPAYVAARSALIDPAGRISSVVPGDPTAFQASAPSIEISNDPDDPETTHFSVVDKWGNAVAFTTTLQGTWGSGIVVPGYGIVLNNSLVLFNLSPKADAATGNPGVNDAGPRKRPTGNAAPVMLFENGEPLVISGTPGGVFIPQVMFQVIVNIVDHHMTLEDAVRAPRFWLGGPEGRIDYNPGFPPETIAALKAVGQKMGTQLGGINVGFAESLGVDSETFDLHAVADMRGEDSAGDVLRP